MTQCDECDWTYRCFDGSVPCVKRLEIPSSVDALLFEGNRHDYEGQIRPRSGLVRTVGVTVANAPGTIDADFRGEVVVLLINLGEATVGIVDGQRIAQLVIAPVVAEAELVEVDDLPATERGSGGFGSTGR